MQILKYDFQISFSQKLFYPLNQLFCWFCNRINSIRQFHANRIASSMTL